MQQPQNQQQAQGAQGAGAGGGAQAAAQPAAAGGGQPPQQPQPAQQPNFQFPGAQQVAQPVVGIGGGSIIGRLTVRPPLLGTHETETDAIVMHRLRITAAADELNITPFVIGPLPQAARVEDINLTRRWLLMAYEDNDLRGLIARHGQDGPTCWLWIGQNLLGGRDEQEVYHSTLSDLRYDTQTAVISYFSTFSMIANAIRPVIPQDRLCQIYAASFPPEYFNIISTCDALGHANFAAFSGSVNRTINRYNQRIALANRRAGHNSLALMTNTGHYPQLLNNSMNDVASWESDCASQGYGESPEADDVYNLAAYMTQSAISAAEAYGMSPNADELGHALLSALSGGLQQSDADFTAFAARMQRMGSRGKGGGRGGRGGRGSRGTSRASNGGAPSGYSSVWGANSGTQMATSLTFNPNRRTQPSSSSPAASPTARQSRCTACGQLGHRAADCDKQPECKHPVCQARKLTRHLPEFCWFGNPSSCPPSCKERRDRLLREYQRKGGANAHFVYTFDDDMAAEVPEDFQDVAAGAEQLMAEVCMHPEQPAADELRHAFDIAADVKVGCFNSYVARVMQHANAVSSLDEWQFIIVEGVIGYAARSLIVDRALYAAATILQNCSAAAFALSYATAFDQLVYSQKKQLDVTVGECIVRGAQYATQLQHQPIFSTPPVVPAHYLSPQAFVGSKEAATTPQTTVTADQLPVMKLLVIGSTPDCETSTDWSAIAVGVTNMLDMVCDGQFDFEYTYRTADPKAPTCYQGMFPDGMRLCPDTKFDCIIFAGCCVFAHLFGMSRGSFLHGIDRLLGYSHSDTILMFVETGYWCSRVQGTMMSILGQRADGKSMGTVTIDSYRLRRDTAAYYAECHDSINWGISLLDYILDYQVEGVYTIHPAAHTRRRLAGSFMTRDGLVADPFSAGIDAVDRLIEQLGPTLALPLSHADGGNEVNLLRHEVFSNDDLMSCILRHIPFAQCNVATVSRSFREGWTTMIIWRCSLWRTTAPAASPRLISYNQWLVSLSATPDLPAAAYLQGEPEEGETVFSSLPPGYSDPPSSSDPDAIAQQVHYDQTASQLTIALTTVRLPTSTTVAHASNDDVDHWDRLRNMLNDLDSDDDDDDEDSGNDAADDGPQLQSNDESGAEDDGPQLQSNTEGHCESCCSQSDTSDAPVDPEILDETSQVATVFLSVDGNGIVDVSIVACATGCTDGITEARRDAAAMISGDGPSTQMSSNTPPLHGQRVGSSGSGRKRSIDASDGERRRSQLPGGRCFCPRAYLNGRECEHASHYLPMARTVSARRMLVEEGSHLALGNMFCRFCRHFTTGDDRVDVSCMCPCSGCTGVPEPDEPPPSRGDLTSSDDTRRGDDPPAAYGIPQQPGNSHAMHDGQRQSTQINAQLDSNDDGLVPPTETVLIGLHTLLGEAFVTAALRRLEEARVANRRQPAAYVIRIESSRLYSSFYALCKGGQLRGADWLDEAFGDPLNTTITFSQGDLCLSGLIVRTQADHRGTAYILASYTRTSSRCMGMQRLLVGMLERELRPVRMVRQANATPEEDRVQLCRKLGFEESQWATAFVRSPGALRIMPSVLIMDGGDCIAVGKMINGDGSDGDDSGANSSAPNLHADSGASGLNDSVPDLYATQQTNAHGDPNSCVPDLYSHEQMHTQDSQGAAAIILSVRPAVNHDSAVYAFRQLTTATNERCPIEVLSTHAGRLAAALCRARIQGFEEPASTESSVRAIACATYAVLNPHAYRDDQASVRARYSSITCQLTARTVGQWRMKILNMLRDARCASNLPHSPPVVALPMSVPSDVHSGVDPEKELALFDNGICLTTAIETMPLHAVRHLVGDAAMLAGPHVELDALVDHALPVGAVADSGCSELTLEAIMGTVEASWERLHVELDALADHALPVGAITGSGDCSELTLDGIMETVETYPVWVNNFEMHHSSYSNSAVTGVLPKILVEASTMVPDSGCQVHLENASGLEGFRTREPTSATVSTGLTGNSPCAFVGTHVCYMLGAPPSFDIVEMVRRGVLYHSTFRRSLFSTGQAFEQMQLRCQFDDICMLAFPCGQRVPFYRINGGYILPRWFSLEVATEARQYVVKHAQPPPSYMSGVVYGALLVAEARGTQDCQQDFTYAEMFYAPIDEGGDALDATPDGDAMRLLDRLFTFSRSAEEFEMLGTTTDARTRLIKKWHARMGHLSPRLMTAMPACVDGAEELTHATRTQVMECVGHACNICPKAHMKRKPHQKKELRGYTLTDPIRAFGDSVATDNAGPWPSSYCWGFTWLTIFVDFHTNFIAVYFSTSKGYSDSIPIRKRFIADHTKYGRIAHFHSDAARELTEAGMISFLHDQGITASWNVPGESDMNNRAEAAIYLIVSMARAIRIHSGIPTSHWPLLILYATYVRNRCPMIIKASGEYTTRLSLARKQRHTISEIRVFGCVCHALIAKKDRALKSIDAGLGEVAISGFFMGFPRYQPGGAVYIWRPTDGSRGKYHVAYSVQFNEGLTYKDAWKVGREVSTAYDEEDAAQDARDADTDQTPTIQARDSLGTPQRSPMDAGRVNNPATMGSENGGDGGDDGDESDERRANDMARHQLQGAGGAAGPSGAAPINLRPPEVCRTPGCTLPINHLGPHSHELEINQRATVQPVAAQPHQRLPASDSGDPTDPQSRTFRRMHPRRGRADFLAAFADVEDCDLSDFPVHDAEGDEVAGLLLANVDRMEIEALHSAVYETYFKPWEDVEVSALFAKKVKAKKPKSKPCLIEDILRNISIPRNMREVMSHEFCDDFIQACEKEMTEHRQNNTWRRLVPRTSQMNVVGSTWSFDIKRDMVNRILRFKARLCGQGFTQIKGVDYFEKYSHAVPLEVLRLFFAVCANEGLEATEADYTTAYLNAKLDTVIYMRQAPGFELKDVDGNVVRGPNGEELVYELDKAIYGLIQSGLMWEKEHHSTLISLGWEQCTAEPTLFRKRFDDCPHTCYICTYVDNVFMGFPPGSKHRAVELAKLGERYKVTDLGPVAFSLGARVIQNPRVRHTTIHQKPMIDEIVGLYKHDIVENPKGSRTVPSDLSIHELAKSDPESSEAKKWAPICLKLGGKVNYIAVFTRPDISAALSFAMRNVAGANEGLYKALLKIVRYLRDTSGYQLHFGAGLGRELRDMAMANAPILTLDPWGDFDVMMFCDASQGGERPMQCALIFVGGSVFAWRVGRLTATSLSSCEAEWFAQTLGATMLQALLPVLNFLGVNVLTPVISFCDNTAAVCISENDGTTKRLKHVITRMAYLRERKDDGDMTLIHLNTKGMVADIGTKVLAPDVFHRHRAFLVWD
jgi:hypothetical protein